MHIASIENGQFRGGKVPPTALLPASNHITAHMLLAIAQAAISNIILENDIIRPGPASVSRNASNGPMTADHSLDDVIQILEPITER